MKFSIRLKLVLFTFTIVVLVGGSISLYSLFLGQRRMLAAFEDDARRTAALISGAVVNDIYSLDLRSLQHRLESARLNSDIRYAVVMDSEGAILSDGNSTNVLRDRKHADPFTLSLLQANDWISTIEPPLLKLGGPVFMPDGSRVGYLEVGFSLRRINEVVRDTTRSSLYLTAGAFAVAFLLAFALGASFSHPVLTVARAAKDIGEGRFDTRLSVTRSDELGMLAQSINVMAETLQARHGELKQTVQLLEQEITERKQAEETVRHSEERFRSLVSVITDVPWVTDATGAFVTPQPAWEAYTGQRWEEHRGFGWFNAFHPEDRERIKKRWNDACATGNLYQSEGRCWCARRQQWRYVNAKATPLSNLEGSVREWVGTCTDVDEQKRAKHRLENTVMERTKELRQANQLLLHDIEERKTLEKQVLQAQKMEGIGTLAAGIAHDFNNILNIIQGHGFILRAYSAGNKQMGQSLAVINETVQRGSALVQQLLTMARKSSTEFEWVNANLVIEKMIGLISQTFPKTIELTSTLEVDLPAIKADKNQIEQALLNLCVNARDAMPDGGRLIFKTQAVDGTVLDDLPATRDRRYVCVEVSDTGMGMDESVRKRIFEPFFTTKDIGKGSGLGLSVVYGIVQNHAGFIKVESKPGSGTSFRLYFPAIVSDAFGREPTVNLETETVARSDGAATVLVVEDEQTVLSILERVLLQYGYKVLKAADGEKALEIYRSHQQAIDAVLLDIGLPKIAGRDVLLRMKYQNPDVKIVIASGYLEPELKAEIEQAGVSDFLHKPYLFDDMVKTLQSVIEKTPAGHKLH